MKIQNNYCKIRIYEVKQNARTGIQNRNIKSFELADIFDCGQCFRWNKQEDGSYTGVFKKNVMNVQNKEIQ